MDMDMKNPFRDGADAPCAESSVPADLGCEKVRGAGDFLSPQVRKNGGDEEKGSMRGRDRTAAGRWNDVLSGG